MFNHTDVGNCDDFCYPHHFCSSYLDFLIVAKKKKKKVKKKKVKKKEVVKLPPCFFCGGSGIEEEKIKGYRRYKCWSCNGTGTKKDGQDKSSTALQ